MSNVICIIGKNADKHIYNTGLFINYSQQLNPDNYIFYFETEQSLNKHKDFIKQVCLYYNIQSYLVTSSKAMSKLKYILAYFIDAEDFTQYKSNISLLQTYKSISTQAIYKLDSISNEPNTGTNENLSSNLSVKKNYSEKPIIHYCVDSYDNGNLAGVARYDYHIKHAFPKRKFFRAPAEKEDMLSILNEYPNAIVITDNHHACDIPNTHYTYLVHHGIAKTHAEREPDWNEYWKNLCCSGQEKMLQHRDPNMTEIISISQFCYDEFLRHFGELYLKFKNKVVLHTSEFNPNLNKKTWNDKPSVLGNWSDGNKGSGLLNSLKQHCPEFNFNELKVSGNSSIEEHNMVKQRTYLNNDIFLQLSKCEGFSYSSLDALFCGIPVVATNTGVFYKDIPEDCFVKIEWEKVDDFNYIKTKLQYAWDNREELSKKGHEWAKTNCDFDNWQLRMKEIVKT